MTTVHLVYGTTNYEGSTVLVAFETKEAAELMVQRLKDHETTKPRAPTDFEATDEWAAYWVKDDAWRDGSPLGGKFDVWYDDYITEPVEVRQ
jgi:hypothetical protein